MSYTNFQQTNLNFHHSYKNQIIVMDEDGFIYISKNFDSVSLQEESSNSSLKEFSEESFPKLSSSSSSSSSSSGSKEKSWANIVQKDKNSLINSNVIPSKPSSLSININHTYKLNFKPIQDQKPIHPYQIEDLSTCKDKGMEKEKKKEKELNIVKTNKKKNFIKISWNEDYFLEEDFFDEQPVTWSRHSPH